MKNFLSLYFHIPFCLEKCDYCDFYSIVPKNNEVKLFVENIFRDIKEKKSLLPNNFRIRTIYFGGGTPSIILKYYPNFFQDVINQFQQAIKNKIEITVEINPSLIDSHEIDLFFENGINRISAGVQTTDRYLLKLLGRKSFPEKSFKNFKKISNLFTNWSIDIIYGIPDQSIESISKTLEKFFSSNFPNPPKHVSAYQLEIKSNTALKKRNTCLPNENRILEQYEFICNFLKQKNMSHYEVSNFAKKGYCSIHNQAYWNELDYIAFGPGATGKYFCTRTQNTKSRNVSSDKRNGINHHTCLEEPGLLEETYVMMKLRTASGIQFNKFKKRFKKDFMLEYGRGIKKCLDSGHGIMDGNRFKLTEKDWMVLNSILYTVLYSNN